MSIDRTILLNICRKYLRKKTSQSTKDQFMNKLKKNMVFVNYLLETIVMDDPTCDCIVVGDKNEWDELPMSKSLFHSRPDCGLPIGNLSSQLFSNIYLNELDQYIKRNLKCKHFGRYVDDGYIVSESKEELKLMISKISIFLELELKLQLNWRKTKIYDIYQGVSFLGAYLLPYRRYVDNNTLSRMKRRLSQMKPKTLTELRSTVNSMLGVFSHCDSYCIRKVMVGNNTRLRRYGSFSNDVLKYRIF